MDTFLDRLQTVCKDTGHPWGMLSSSDSYEIGAPLFPEDFHGMITRGACSRTGEPWFALRIANARTVADRFVLMLERRSGDWGVRQSKYTLDMKTQYEALDFATRLLTNGSAVAYAGGKNEVYILL